MSLEGVLVGSQQCVDELKQLHHSLVLTKVLVTFEEEYVLTAITACGGEGEGNSREREKGYHSSCTHRSAWWRCIRLLELVVDAEMGTGRLGMGIPDEAMAGKGGGDTST